MVSLEGYTEDKKVLKIQHDVMHSYGSSSSCFAIISKSALQVAKSYLQEILVLLLSFSCCRICSHRVSVFMRKHLCFYSGLVARIVLVDIVVKLICSLDHFSLSGLVADLGQWERYSFRVGSRGRVWIFGRNIRKK